MLMVLCLHSNKDMILVNHFDKLMINSILIYGIESFSIVAVNCYVLISGYFLIKSQTLKIRKAVDIVFLTSFYGFFLYIPCCIFGIESFEVKGLIKSVLPYFFDKVWFINIYLVLYLLHPFINKALISLSKHNYQLLLVILISLFSIWPSFLPNPPSNDKGYGIISFVLMYSIAGYIRLHLSLKKSFIKYIAVYFVLSIITAVLCVTNIIPGSWLNYNSIFVISASVFLFVAFLSIEFESKTVNYISLSMIAVLIIHTHQSIRPHIFLEIFKIQNHLMQSLFVLYYIAMILIIFFICVILDFLRRKIFYLFDKILDKIPVFNSTINIFEKYKSKD